MPPRALYRPCTGLISDAMLEAKRAILDKSITCTSSKYTFCNKIPSSGLFPSKQIVLSQQIHDLQTNT